MLNEGIVPDSVCLSCGGVSCDVDHIRSRGSGGGEEPQNKWRLCRLCHTRKHSEGLSRFIQGNLNLIRALCKKGWHFDEYLKKWRRDK